MDGEIKLSGTEFKALASETRTGIIKLLRDRNHTLTEISKKLQLAAPTIKQHLGILEKAELIQELDEGRKWKYYCLTKKGRNIFSHETPINVFIVLGVTAVALVGLLYSFISMLGANAMNLAARNAAGEAFIAKSGEDMVAGVQASAAQQAPLALAETASAGVPAISPEMVALLMAIVAVSLVAGFLIAKARNF